MRSEKYPILEFDPERRAVIKPSDVAMRAEVSEYCVICFSRNIVESIAETHDAEIVFKDEGAYGTNPFYQMEYHGRRIIFFQPFVGAPLAAMFLELAFALGCRKFIVCGGAGVLNRDIPVGGLVIPSAAVRDEGVSYHYLPAGREIQTDAKAMGVIRSTLDDHGESYRIAKTWTTDAVFRETDSRVRRRKSEGCLTVEMEASALFAVAQFRDADLGYILYGCDDVSREEWDERSEKPRASIVEKLFWLSAEACLKL